MSKVRKIQWSEVMIKVRSVKKRSVHIMPCLDLPVMLKYSSSSPVIVVNVEPIMMRTTLLQQVSLLH